MGYLLATVAGNSGIGFYILQAQQVLSPRAIFAGILTLGVVGYVLNTLFLVVERRLLHWHVSSARSGAE